MIGLMRNVAILFAVLVVALVLATAGEGACAECVHGCCVRNDGVRRLISAIRRVIRRLTSLVEPVMRAFFTPPLGLQDHAVRPTPCAVEVAPLRI
ncbi:MAG: hypothetical protein CVT59_04405 [Actinobacteria bacterium HGW-Actinobacteria-1]|jgi:hypothetical protein|nr:MAG: hypothetical protein CVT59_04405 [Actinobacteria bacterium HGW-Actinobacteria-1]